MTNIIINLFILAANVVSILLIYHSFDKNIEKTKKLLYTMISMGVVYIIVLITYFFSSIGLSKEVTQKSQDMITFTFVPVNAIIIVPFLLRSFNQRKNKDITTEQLNKRTIIVAILAIVIVVGEFFYFRSIEKGIIDIANQKQDVVTNDVENNTENTTLSNSEITNSEIENSDITNNLISNGVVTNEQAE